jgi:predicted transcriptional regulator
METRPTNGELEILGVLWRRGPSSVRAVHEELSRNRNAGYTTVLKLMQIMADKGLVTRDTGNRAHVYSPAVEQSEARRSLTEDLVTRLFEGSAAQLAMQALGSKKANPEELAEIRQLLDHLEAEQ